jgi:hypothetical protein
MTMKKRKRAIVDARLGSIVKLKGAQRTARRRPGTLRGGRATPQLNTCLGEIAAPFLEQQRREKRRASPTAKCRYEPYLAEDGDDRGERL